MTRKQSKHFSAALTLMALAAIAHAGTYSAATGAASGTRNLPGPTDNQNQTGAAPVSVVSNSSQIETFSGNISGVNASFSSQANSTATASAGPGTIKLFAAAGAQTAASRAPSTGQSGSSAYGALNDNFTIVASGCVTCSAGAIGTLSFAVDFHGNPTGSGTYQSDIAPGSGGGGFTHSSSWNTGLSLNAGYVPGAANTSADANASGWYSSDQSGVISSGSTGLGYGTHSKTISFAFGQSINLQWLAYAYASGAASSTGYETSFSSQSFAQADFANTFAWAGILSVLDANGQAVTGFTAFNAEGVDYAQSFVTAAPVPEPSTALLTLAGLGAMAAVVRRRRFSR